MARKDISPAISFFSFQDIITSLTGIMFLVVLLLVILLTEMNTPAAAPEIAIMQAKIAENESELVSLRKRVSEGEELRKKLPSMPLDAIKIQLSLAGIEAEELRSELVSLREKADQASTQKETARREREMQTEQLKQEESRLDEEKNQLREMQENAQALEQKIRDRRRFARIRVENRTPLRPVLIECRKSGIRVLDVSSGKVTDLRPAGSDPARQTAALKTHLAGRPANQEYYTLLVAPEAFADYAPLSGSDLGIREEQRGLEFYPDDLTTIFQEAQQ